MSHDPRSKPAMRDQETSDLERSMRRTLGVGTPSAGHRRRFAQDGDVPVVVVRGRRDDGREAAESAMQSEREARGQAERSLAAAHATIRDLQTKLAHVEMSQAELRRSVDRLGAERQSLEISLAAEANAHKETEARLEQATADRQELERQLRSLSGRTPRAGRGPAQGEPQPIDWWSKHEKD